MENKSNVNKKKFRKDKMNEDLDTALMNDKIKKIKKRKQKNNFKNIEEFDTLHNREEDEPIHKKEEETVTPASIKNKIFEVFDSFLNTKEEMRGFSRDDYEGYDNVYEGARSDFDPRNWLIQAIEAVYNSFNGVNTWIAKTIVDNLKMPEKTYKKYNNKGSYNYKNKVKDDNNDIAIIREQVVWLLAIVFSMFAVLNWYFILYYSKYEDIEITRIARKTLLEMSSPENGQVVSHMAKFIFFIFEFAVFFVEMFNDFLILFFPKITMFFLDGRTNFLLLFIILVFAFKNFGKFFKNFLIDLLTNATDNYYINIMYAILFIEFFVSVAEGPKTIGVPTVDEDQIRTFMASLANPLLFILVLIIRFMIIMIVSVPVGGLMIGALFLYYSFFGILHYVGSERWFSTVEHILDYAKNAESKYKSEKYCNTNAFYMLLLKILQIISTVSSLLYLFKYYLAFIIIFIVSAIIFYNKLSLTPSIFGNTSFKVFMSSSSGFMTLPLVTFMFAYMRDNEELREILSFAKTNMMNVFKDKEIPQSEKPEIYEKFTSKSKSIFESMNKIIQEGRKQRDKKENGGGDYDDDGDSIDETNEEGPDGEGAEERADEGADKVIDIEEINIKERKNSNDE